MSRLKDILTQLSFYKQGDFYCSRHQDYYTVIHETHLKILEEHLDNTKMWVQGSSLVYHPPQPLQPSTDSSTS